MYGRIITSRYTWHTFASSLLNEVGSGTNPRTHFVTYAVNDNEDSTSKVGIIEYVHIPDATTTTHTTTERKSSEDVETLLLQVVLPSIRILPDELPLQPFQT